MARSDFKLCTLTVIHTLNSRSQPPFSNRAMMAAVNFRTFGVQTWRWNSGTSAALQKIIRQRFKDAERTWAVSFRCE